MRTARQGSVACLLMNPLSQLYLATIAPKMQITGYSLNFNVVFKGTAHYLILSPFMMFIFLYGTAYLRNLNHTEGLKNWRDRFVKTWYTGLMFFPLANTFAYKYPPLHLRQPCLELFNFCWSIMLSLLNNMKM